MVPQDKTLNSGAWSEYEKELTQTFINAKCSKVFVLTGVIPSTNPDSWIKRGNKNRVNIPDYIWNAYCCVDNNGKPVLSGAAAAENSDVEVEKKTMDELKQFFQSRGRRGVTELFQNNCQ